MSSHFTFLLLGLGVGAVIAALGIGVVVTHRASGIINFAHAAVGMFLAFSYYELRATGDLVLPIIGLPDRFHLVDRPTVGTALVVIVVYAMAFGAALYWLIFRHLGTAPPLAGLVASLGLLLYLITVAGLRFDQQGAAAFIIDGPLPDQLVTIAGVVAPLDRYLLAGGVIATTALLWWVYRSSMFGLRTRAVSENRTAATMIGISPHPIGIVNWGLAAVLAALAMIMAAPIIRLDPGTSSLLIVPALAAALPGRFRSLPVTAATGLAIGMAQSEILNLQADWEWLPDVGLQQGLPFALVLVTLFVRGDPLPGRSALTGVRLPRPTVHRHARVIAVGVAVASVVGLLALDSQWRTGIIVSSITATFALSVVVLTGLVGQISLATFAVAGVAAFSMVRISDDLSLPFPIPPLLGAGVAVIVSVVSGLAALRTRGMTLAIATLAAAVAVEELLFRWGWLTGGLTGATVTPPSAFGIDLRISAAGDLFPRWQFGILVVIVLLICLLGVINLRLSGTGRRWLAVRANDRAAEAAGINIGRTKLGAFAIAGLIAGLAGTMLAYRRELVTSSSFGVLDSIVAVAITYLAGAAAPLAALVAGVLGAGGLLTVALERLSPGSSDVQLAVNGLMLIVAAIKFPSGILGVRRQRRVRPASRRTPR